MANDDLQQRLDKGMYGTPSLILKNNTNTWAHFVNAAVSP